MLDVGTIAHLRQTAEQKPSAEREIIALGNTNSFSSFFLESRSLLYTESNKGIALAKSRAAFFFF